jgi:hypothetical protein
MTGETDPMLVALTVIHIAIAAAWFGHKLLIPGDIRRSAAAGDAQADAFLARLRRAQGFGILTGFGTVLSGGMLAWEIGVERVRPGVWVGAGLVIVAIALGAIVARPASRRLVDAVQASDRVGASRASAQVRSVLGIESLLWMGALTAMVW